MFVAKCKVGDLCTLAEGRSKKLAKNQAAKLMMVDLQQQPLSCVRDHSGSKAQSVKAEVKKKRVRCICKVQFTPFCAFEFGAVMMLVAAREPCVDLCTSRRLVTCVPPGDWWPVYLQETGDQCTSWRLVTCVPPGDWWPVYLQETGDQCTSWRLVTCVPPGGWWPVYLQETGDPCASKRLVTCVPPSDWWQCTSKWLVTCVPPSDRWPVYLQATGDLCTSRRLVNVYRWVTGNCVDLCAFRQQVTCIPPGDCVLTFVLKMCDYRTLVYVFRTRGLDPTMAQVYTQFLASFRSYSLREVKVNLYSK